MKTVYQLDPQGVYIGESAADESPLEPGVFLVPANCVEVPPPAIPIGYVARFAGGVWALEALPAPEPDVPISSAEQVLAERDRLYDASYKALLDAFEASMPVSQAWQDYRQALRDIPQQPGFPYDVIWPEHPQTS